MLDKNFPILDEEQADNLVELMKDMLGSETSIMLNASHINPNHFIRYMYISQLCKKTRVEKGISFKEISTQLKIPQCQLKAVEENLFGAIKKDVLQEYIKYLGIGKEFQEWLKKNKDVYDEIDNTE